MLKAAWQKTLEETGVNPFPQGFSSTLSQLAMERWENPLSVVSERNAEFVADEKTFYADLLNNLT